MKLFVKILVFVLVAFVVNMNATSVAIAFPDFQKTTASFSFHNETPKTIYKVLEKDLADCCQNGESLVAYREWGIGVEVVPLKGYLLLQNRQQALVKSWERTPSP